MKKYIRSTHNFNNETREWEYRGDPGGDKYEEWKDHGDIVPDNVKWSLGVHVLLSNYWVSMDWIIEETISSFKNGAYDGSSKTFDKFVKSNLNYRDIIREHIERDFERLIKLDMVRLREK